MPQRPHEVTLHTCPTCRTEWEDEILVCPEDGTRLLAPAPPKRAPPPGRGAAPARSPAPGAGPSKPAPKAAPKAEPEDQKTAFLGVAAPKPAPAKPAPKAAPAAQPEDQKTAFLGVAAPKLAPAKAAPKAEPEDQKTAFLGVAAPKPVPKAAPKAEPEDQKTAFLGVAAPKPAPAKSAPSAPPADPSEQKTDAFRPAPAPEHARPAPAAPAQRAIDELSNEPSAEPAEEEEEYDEQIGLTVGSYQVTKLLGKGGMGSVYMAEHPVIHSRVAIKFLHPQFSDNKKIVDRFFNEARAVNLIGHDNILKILDLNATEDGRHYFVMELLEGQPLQALVEPGLPVPLEVAGPILLQFCEALEAAHNRHIFHRDVKPDNVYLVNHKGHKNFVKVVDFGIAKLTDPGPGQKGTGTTQTGMVVGTPAYMSPEQAGGVHSKIDARSDVYSTGVMMFQLATGKLPFPSSNFGEVLIGHMRLDPPRPRELNPEIPVEYESIILQALAKEQDARQQSMSELGRQIAEVMHALQISKELPIADEVETSQPGMVRLQSDASGQIGRKKRAPPRFGEAQVQGKAKGPLKKSGQTLATRVAAPPTALFDRARAPEPPPSALRNVAIGLGGLVLLGAVVALSILFFGSADPLHRAHRHKQGANPAVAAAASDEPVGPTLLSVVSEPLGATVEATWRDGGNQKGTTPLDVRVPRDTKVTLIFSLPGYAPYRQDVIADESQVVTAQMQKDGSSHLTTTHGNRHVDSSDDVINVEDELK